MHDYKHPRLVALLLPQRLPEELEQQVAKFKRIAEGVSQTKETLEMLKKADDNLCLQILAWMKQNQSNDPLFTSFYTRLRKLIEGDSLEKSYQSQLLWKGQQKTFYHLRFLKATLFGDCSYYQLDKWTSKGKERKRTDSFTLKGCPDAGTLEPIYFQSESGEEHMSYDYLNNGTEANQEEQEILNGLFSSFLEELEKNAVVLSHDKLFNTLPQLLIALTY